MRGYLYNLKKYAAFSHKEVSHYLFVAILVGFYYSFNDWGYVSETGEAVIDYTIGVGNLLVAIFGVLLILGLIILAQKGVAMLFGYTVEYVMSWFGLLVGFFVTGFSNGLIPFFLPGACHYELVKTARLGKYRQFFNMNELFLVTSMAVVVPLLLTIPFSALYLFTEIVMFKTLTLMCLLFAAFALIPLPNFASLSKWNLHGVTDFKLLKKFDGGTYGYDMFLFNSTAYILLALTAALFIALALLFSVFSFIVSFFLALLLYFIYKIMIRYMQK